MTRALRQQGIRLIEGMIKSAAAPMHPVEQMRSGQQYNIGIQGLQNQLGVTNPDTALAENDDYNRQVTELYNRFLAPQPAAERAPKVISVAK